MKETVLGLSGKESRECVCVCVTSNMSNYIGLTVECISNTSNHLSPLAYMHTSYMDENKTHGQQQQEKRSLCNTGKCRFAEHHFSFFKCI